MRTTPRSFSPSPPLILTGPITLVGQSGGAKRGLRQDHAQPQVQKHVDGGRRGRRQERRCCRCRYCLEGGEPGCRCSRRMRHCVPECCRDWGDSPPRVCVDRALYVTPLPSTGGMDGGKSAAVAGTWGLFVTSLPSTDGILSLHFISTRWSSLLVVQRRRRI